MGNERFISQGATYNVPDNRLGDAISGLAKGLMAGQERKHKSKEDEKAAQRNAWLAAINRGDLVPDPNASASYPQGFVKAPEIEDFKAMGEKFDALGKRRSYLYPETDVPKDILWTSFVRNQKKGMTDEEAWSQTRKDFGMGSFEFEDFKVAREMDYGNESTKRKKMKEMANRKEADLEKELGRKLTEEEENQIVKEVGVFVGRVQEEVEKASQEPQSPEGYQPYEGSSTAPKGFTGEKVTPPTYQPYGGPAAIPEGYTGQPFQQSPDYLKALSQALRPGYGQQRRNIGQAGSYTGKLGSYMGQYNREMPYRQAQILRELGPFLEKSGRAMWEY